MLMKKNPFMNWGGLGWGFDKSEGDVSNRGSRRSCVSGFTKSFSDLANLQGIDSKHRISGLIKSIKTKKHAHFQKNTYLCNVVLKIIKKRNNMSSFTINIFDEVVDFIISSHSLPK